MERLYGAQVAGWTGDEFHLRNCTWHGGRFDLSRWYSAIPVSAKDCVFDGTSFTLDNYANKTFDYNAFTNGAQRLTPTGANDVPVTDFNWQNGPQGGYFLPADSGLVEAGSRTAAEAGLYHYTTQLSQEKEGNSQVDIGYHYVALNDGTSVDSDGDGLPDYQEDSNGNGIYDTGDLSNFESTDSDGDGLADNYEVTATQTDPSQADTGNTGTPDGYKDPDGDGWTNLEEANRGTDPLHPNVGSLTFTPVGGNYASAQNVVVTCPTPGVTIHYTLTGAEPAETDPAIVSGSAILISQTCTLKAKAWKTGWTASDTETQSYHIPGTANQPPTVTVSPPSGTSFSASDDIEILVEASDSDGTITKVQLYRDSYEVAESDDSPLRYLLKNVVEGTYTCTAKATDNAGAVTVSSPTTITVGGTGPIVTLVGSQPFFTSSPGTLVANIIGVNPGALTSLMLNGSPFVPRAGQFSLTVALVEGANTFTLAATDNLGRDAQATATVYLDSVAPAISITAPANSSSFNTDRINVQGTFTESSLKRITVNDVVAFISGNTFAALNVPLLEGPNTITATAEDIAGNQTSASITVNGSATPVDAVQLQATPVGGFAPLQVTFTPSAAVPGTIQQVLYDFTGDNTTFQTANDLNPITHTYTSAGEFFPVVTIQTTAGRFSSAGGWNAPFGRLRVNVQTPPVLVSVINVTDPVDLKWMPGGNLYVLSRSTATLREYDSAGTVVRSLSGIGSTPTGLDVDTSGNAYVALSGENHVAKDKPAGGSFQLDTSFNGTGVMGSAGSGDGQFNTPFDVAVTPDGEEIAVSDSGNHRIERFSSAGEFIQAFGAQGSGAQQFNTPKGLAYDDVGNLYVVDAGNSRIVLTDSVASLGTSGSYGTALGRFSGPVNLGVGSRGIYTADTGNNRVQAFDPLKSGQSPPFNPRLALNSQFSPALSQPYAVSAVSNLLQELIYIADTGNNRVLLVQLSLDTPEWVWEAMKARLEAGDVEGALPYFFSVTADAYRDMFLTIGPAKVAADMNAIVPLTPVFIENGEAEYYFEQTVEGQLILFPVEFVKENGAWKVVEF